MAIQVKRVNPFDVREAVVELFWKLRTWPYATKDEYFRYWDWGATPEFPRRFLRSGWLSTAAKSSGTWPSISGAHASMDMPRVRGTGKLSGASSSAQRLDRRRARKAPRMMVRSGEIDIPLGYGNKAADSMLVGVGSHDLGTMRPYVEVRQWAPVLGGRFVGAAMRAPIASITVHARKAVSGANWPVVPQGFWRGRRGATITRKASIFFTVLSRTACHWRNRGQKCPTPKILMIGTNLKLISELYPDRRCF